MAVRFDNKRILLNVNDLVSPHHRSFFLSSFPLHKRGMLGQKAHRRLQQRRSRSYGMFRSEYHLHRVFDFQGYEIDLQGRVDGIYHFTDCLEVEEIKSVLLSRNEFRELNAEDYPGFSEQLLFYAWFLAEEFRGLEIKTFLILINLTDDRERVFPVPYNQETVGALITERLQSLIEQKEMRDRTLRFRKYRIRELDLSLREQRPQQEGMMEQVRDCLETHTHLLASAPTGTGKTIAALFPAIQYAWLNDKKVYFGTSKTTQQHLAAGTVRMLIDRGLEVNAVVLRSAEKMCANETFFCHEDYCPFAREYRRRFEKSELREKLYEHKLLLPDQIYDMGVKEMLCPFEASLDFALRADVVIGDYNYIFDPAVHLGRLFTVKDYADWILVLDEAHNLLERGMNWLSPSLERAQVKELMWSFEGNRHTWARDLHAALKEIDTSLEDVHQEGELLHEGERCFLTRIDPDLWDRLFISFENAYIRYLIYKIKHRKVIPDDPAESFYFSLRHFLQVARIEEPSLVPYCDAIDGGLLRIRCCNPADYLKERLERFSSVIAMSATLEPMDYYQRLLGFSPERTIRLSLDSPFDQTRRKCVIVPGVSTRFRDRQMSYPKIAEMIREIVSIRPGNYLVFFPGFDYLQSVYIFLGNVDSEILIQRPRMSEEQRNNYLQTLKEEGPHLLLGVTGGIFAEGVDYPGDMAIGVIVISPSLPAVSYEQEILRGYYDDVFGLGMEYAYIYPGMNRVIQAVGRLIRTSQDCGVAVLIGERFAEDAFQDLLPVHWFREKGDIEITDDYRQAIEEFWEKRSTIQ